MFSYLRYFSVISAVVITLAAIALGYYFRSSAAEDVSHLVVKNNKVLVQGFINNVWRKHPMVGMLDQFSTHDIPSTDWYKYRGYKENYESFSRDVFKYFEEMPVVHVNVYAQTGEKLLAFNQSKILEKSETGIRLPEAGEAAAAVSKALAGSVASSVLQGSKFQIADGSRSEGTLVQTTVPILSDQYVPLLAGADGYDKASNIKGMVEIYYDITPQWAQLYQFQYVGTGAIILIFLILIGALTLVASKAESIIAKQHDANVELAAQAAAAETENENKSQFLASISHELRTPLNAIIGFSEIIKNETMGPVGNEQYKDYVRDIHNSGVHLLSLINDILDYSKAEAGKLDLIVEEVDITKLIHSSIRLVAPRAEHAKVNLLAEVPKEHYLLHTDGKKVKQILLNLLSNAVKFTPEGGNVKTAMWQDVLENRITIEVTDSGIGIAPKDISKALSPFGQVDSALSRKYEGTGLGLPLTKKFVEIMGGVFEIESEEDKGTTVRFSLPMNSPISDTDKAPQNEPSADRPEPSETETRKPVEKMNVSSPEAFDIPTTATPSPVEDNTPPLALQTEENTPPLPTAAPPSPPSEPETPREAFTVPAEISPPQTADNTPPLSPVSASPPTQPLAPAASPEEPAPIAVTPPAPTPALASAPEAVSNSETTAAEAPTETTQAPQAPIETAPSEPEPDAPAMQFMTPEQIKAASKPPAAAATPTPKTTDDSPAPSNQSGFGEGAFELAPHKPSGTEG